MTLPFGIRDELILGNEARNYTENSIKIFSSLAEPVLLEYYEYQHSRCNKLFRENESLFSKIKSKLVSLFKENKNEVPSSMLNDFTKLIGPVTWRCVPQHKAQARHYSHTEGVLCGVWRKTINT